MERKLGGREGGREGERDRKGRGAEREESGRDCFLKKKSKNEKTQKGRSWAFRGEEEREGER